MRLIISLYIITHRFAYYMPNSDAAERRITILCIYHI